MVRIEGEILSTEQGTIHKEEMKSKKKNQERSF